MNVHTVEVKDQLQIYYARKEDMRMNELHDAAGLRISSSVLQREPNEPGAGT